VWYRTLQIAQSGRHHRLAVGPGVVRVPKHVGHIGVELGAPGAQPRQILVLEVLALLCRDEARGLDVTGRQLVADAAAARVQNDPNAEALVDARFGEMVPSPE
jgi:hypothetical protein